MVKEEIGQSFRGEGYSSIKDVDAVILETDGSLSIISRVSSEDGRIPDVEQMKNKIKALSI